MSPHQIKERSAPPLVSVVIPCFNQGHFLGQAIESVLAQTYPHVEVIVVDDGSTDNTWEVAGQYAGVHRLRQPNSGLSAARNAGLATARGAYVVFLDADDLLRRDALEIGIEHLSERPECAFVSGRYQRIATNLLPLPTPEQECIRSHHHLAMLRGNYIGMHAAVMYRRGIFEAVGGFDTSLAAAEDYDLYLRITRNFPVCCHERVIAEYRQHQANMSRDPGYMLAAVLRVLRSHWKDVRGDPERARAYQDGIRNWREYYATELFKNAGTAFRQGAAIRALRQALAGVRLYPSGRWMRRTGRQFLRRCRRWVRRPGSAPVSAPAVGQVSFGDMRRTTPLSPASGSENARSIERYYADRFFRCHANDIRGQVLEFGDGAYARMLAARAEAVTAGDWNGLGELAPAAYDCIIVSRGLESVYCLEPAVVNLHRALRPGGVLLTTLAGLRQSPASDEQQDYWRFTQVSARRLFETVFRTDDLTIRSYGNVLAAIMLLEGLSTDQLHPDELDHIDPDYEVTIGIRGVNSA